MHITLISTIVISVFAAVFLIVGLVWGVKRGFARSLFRLLTLIAAAVVAYLISVGLSVRFGPQIQTKLFEWVDANAAQISEILHASPSLITYALGIVCSLIAPILYSLLFFLLRLLFWIVYAALCLFLPSRRKKSLDGLSRLTGVVVSVAGSALIVISLLMPYAGYLGVAAEMYPKVLTADVLTEESIASMPEGLEAELNAASDSTAVGLVNRFGGTYLFGALTASGGVDVETEFETFLLLFPAVRDIAAIDFGAMFDPDTELDLSPIREELIPAIGTSEDLTQILAEILSYAGGKWLAGEEVLSVNIREQLPEDYKDALDAPLQRLANTTKATVLADLTDLTDCIETVAKTYTYLSLVGDASSTVSQAELRENMEGILASLTPGSAELVSSAITATLVNNAQVGENTEAVASIVSDAIMDVATLSEEEKKAEAAAINNLISYTSDTRQEEVDASEVLDAVLASQVVRDVVTEKGAVDETTGQAQTTIKVSDAQYDAMNAVIDAKETEELTEEERNTLEALRRILVTSSGDESGETGGETGGEIDP